jgi:hypothetical protein
MMKDTQTPKCLKNKQKKIRHIVNIHMIRTKIIEPTFGLNLYLAIALPYVYISLIAIGFILSGLGLWRLKMKQ